jgi:transcriptional regulator with XRE-family HTH domain
MNTSEDKKRRALAQFLKQTRQERGWSQREFARRAGVTHATLNSWESAKTTADTKNLEKIANVLAMPAWELMRILNENCDNNDADFKQVIDILDRSTMSQMLKINSEIASRLAQAS